MNSELGYALIKRSVKRAMRTVAPKWFWKSRLRHLQEHVHEPEQRLLPALTDKRLKAVDVGAASGSFIAHLMGHVAEVVAFEPRPHQASELAEMARVLGLPVTVHPIALSDRNGTVTLRMVVNDQGLSTIESRNRLEDTGGGPQVEVEVPMKRLDDFELDGLGFLKVDVEGHELAVLDGATRTLERTRCSVLIESEDRHCPGATSAVIAWMAARRYEGYFLLDGRLTPISQFEQNKHQNKSNIGDRHSGWARRGVYVNNFMFVPSERSDEFVLACQKIQSKVWT